MNLVSPSHFLHSRVNSQVPPTFDGPVADDVKGCLPVYCLVISLLTDRETESQDAELAVISQQKDRLTDSLFSLHFTP